MGFILMKYKDELIKSMSFLGKKKDTIFFLFGILLSVLYIAFPE